MPVVQQVLPAEAAGRGEIVRLDKCAHVIAAACGPVAPPQDDERLLRLRKHFTQAIHVCNARMRFHSCVRARIDGYRLTDKHVFRQ